MKKRIISAVCLFVAMLLLLTGCGMPSDFNKKIAVDSIVSYYSDNLNETISADSVTFVKYSPVSKKAEFSLTEDESTADSSKEKVYYVSVSDGVYTVYDSEDNQIFFHLVK